MVGSSDNINGKGCALYACVDVILDAAACSDKCGVSKIAPEKNLIFLKVVFLG